mmetsp:Transcript_43854/g.92231  ORF Transcript_43854/g.92231 Transcript_43854/m.92231 type:complete len:309 (+) Transcript_43854:258-1184(+)|eukprot:CAMPEP_0183732100 /NCGR_PEP_ID=MMETSP0737-20130205/37506_1 /TAXON_ID=385413 /ORGANISM="Thalassiosira miniscula, Strain CCMP1093" /LENGTH=308 /DNA_ID=CAMNT_0025965017 /DNA_START=181 /DNA_END=1107 /DNA_ORIENTATION=+
MNSRKQTKGPLNRALRWHLLSCALMLDPTSHECSAFVFPRSSLTAPTLTTTTQLFHWANRLDNRFSDSSDISSDSVRSAKLQPLPEQFTRRSLLSIGVASTTLTTLLSPLVANADFAPGGTLLDREVSIFYGNPEASPSRARDNSNVLFVQDNFYKFGAAAQWIPAGSTEFPKTMPFVLSQQRYDALKKYGSRVKSSMEIIEKIGNVESLSDVPERTDPMYQLRALGLLANSFLASENTGTTNELMLARWYVNEIYLRIGDYRDALSRGDTNEAKSCYTYLIKAMNSYLSLLNRSITSKVGDQFSYIV